MWRRGGHQGHALADLLAILGVVVVDRPGPASRNVLGLVIYAHPPLSECNLCQHTYYGCRMHSATPSRLRRVGPAPRLVAAINSRDSLFLFASPGKELSLSYDSRRLATDVASTTANRSYALAIAMLSMRLYVVGFADD